MDESVESERLRCLSPREREVFDLAVALVPNMEIAVRMGISLKTVQTHRAKLNAKLGVHSPAQLVVFAHRVAEGART